MSDDLFERLCRGERGAVAEALNLVDDQRPEQRKQALALLAKITQRPGSNEKRKVGLTGAPGAGKSTLLDALIHALRKKELRVGVIAVDPSSQRSGGALLGDRLRVNSRTGDSGVFFRSMAARDRLGGLAAAARAGAAILGVAFDWVLIETVGIGQSEADILDLVDSLIYVGQPGAGDVIQYMKAGVLEAPDLFVINKADLGAVAEGSRNALAAGLSLAQMETGSWEAPVLLASARDKTGIDEILETIEAHRSHLGPTGISRRRTVGRDQFVLTELAHQYGRYGVNSIGGIDSLRKQLAVETGRSEFTLVEKLGQHIEDTLGKRD